MDANINGKKDQQIIKQQDFNTRAGEMWDFITTHVDFKNRTVADFGCGYGDFVWRAIDAGASRVTAFDKKQKFEILMPYDLQIDFVQNDIENIEIIKMHDIGLCFSVLPYLRNPREFLSFMYANVIMSLIEVQYEPEPYNIGVDNDTDMMSMLHECGFDFVMPIGKTFIAYRNIYRTIWMCT